MCWRCGDVRRCAVTDADAMDLVWYAYGVAPVVPRVRVWPWGRVRSTRRPRLPPTSPRARHPPARPRRRPVFDPHAATVHLTATWLPPDVPFSDMEEF